MSDTLFEAPHRDEFQTESPLRAFTTFNAEGGYAIGKGFRPSLHHLPTYLDAIERKEGWKLLQILEPAHVSGNPPSFVFRRLDPVMVTIPPIELDESAMSSIRRHLDLQFVNTKIDPVMPEQRGENPWAEQRDYGDEDPIDPYVKIRPLLEEAAAKMDAAEKRAVGMSPALGAPYGLADPAGDDLELKGFAKPADDPVNPAHYNGTECAEIIENLPGNLAHAITYIWRAGDKPDQPLPREIDKACWFLEREERLAQALIADAEDEDEVELLTGQDCIMDWCVPGLRNKKVRRHDIKGHRFYKFCEDRVAGLDGWKQAAILHLIVYAIDRKPATIRHAVLELHERRDQ